MNKKHMSSSRSDRMKFTGPTYQQSRMVAGVCVADGNYDELLREALRIALRITRIECATTSTSVMAASRNSGRLRP